MLCPDCLDELTVVCERCGDRVWTDDAADSDITLCQHCYDNYYTTCESCGCTLDYDDAYYLDNDTDYLYCRHYYQQRFSSEYIHDCGFKPDPIFYGKGNRYFGVEFEIDEGGHIDANAEKICDLAINMNDKELTQLNWCDVVSSVEEPKLITYLKERRLYVNEPIECEARGTDATGISFNTESGMHMSKRTVAAHKMWYRIPDSSKVVMGHTLLRQNTFRNN